MSVVLKDEYVKKFVCDREICELTPMLNAAANSLMEGSGAGSDFLGWKDFPDNISVSEISSIKDAAEFIRKNSTVLIVIGIGGSYLGPRAVIEAAKSLFYNSIENIDPKIYFVGNNISSTYVNNIIEICRDQDFCINVISKSGTTTEPAIAFRIFKRLLENKYGETAASSRIFCTTDGHKGKLRELAEKKGYKCFTIPSNIGGRFSVLTAVGLLPIAVAGLNIDEFIGGANHAMHELADCDVTKNCCCKYAILRNILYNKGKHVELFVSYEPSLNVLLEWLKQLFGESEGKDGKGIFPASAIFSTDLHSLGQYIQDGPKFIFETVLLCKKPQKDYYIDKETDDFDGLNFLADQNISEIARKAFEGTVKAHTDGFVPNIVLEIEQINEFEIGYLLYFFEKACALSGYMLGINPFNQPGVETYKKNMFKLLNKPGF